MNKCDYEYCDSRLEIVSNDFVLPIPAEEISDICFSNVYGNCNILCGKDKYNFYIYDARGDSSSIGNALRQLAKEKNIVINSNKKAYNKFEGEISWNDSKTTMFKKINQSFNEVYIKYMDRI